jgi:citrate lyase subunit beta/citryl-CoA lyase
MKPVRSLLYVPANKPDWITSAPTEYDADAIIYDLEDAVPPGEKADAREILADSLPELANEETVITARVNAPGTGEFDADLAAIARPGLDAIVVPKLPAVEDIERASHVLDHREATGDGTDIDLILLPETAQGFTRAEALCDASDRVAALMGSSSPAGDIERALGFEWTPGADERRYLLSKLVMDGRAAGLDQLFAGPWIDVDDLDGLRTEAELSRQLGYTGFQVVHPSHVSVVNDVFTPDTEDVERARKLVDAFDSRADDGVFVFEGDMIDAAHYKRAVKLVERAEAFGLL